MTLSDHDFSSPETLSEFSMTQIWQIQDRGFHPKYDLNVKRSDQASQEEESQGDAKPETDPVSQKIAEAYTQGYLKGQQAAAVQEEQNLEERDRLANALSRLKPVDEAKLAKKLWQAVLTLFQEAVGEAKIDKQLLKQRCDRVIETIGDELGEATLHVAPSDAKILQNHDCAIPIVAMSELLPGSVQLVYASGEIIAGSIAVTQEIENRIGRGGGDPC